MLYLFRNKQIALRNTLLNKDSTPPHLAPEGSTCPLCSVITFRISGLPWLKTLRLHWDISSLTLPLSWVLFTHPLEEACCFYPISWSTQISLLNSCLCRMCTLGRKQNKGGLYSSVPKACLLSSLISTLLLELLFSFVSSWKSTLESQPGSSPSSCSYFICCALLSAGAHKSFGLSTNSSS